MDRLAELRPANSEFVEQLVLSGVEPGELGRDASTFVVETFDVAIRPALEIEVLPLFQQHRLVFSELLDPGRVLRQLSFHPTSTHRPTVGPAPRPLPEVARERLTG